MAIETKSDSIDMLSTLSKIVLLMKQDILDNISLVGINSYKIGLPNNMSIILTDISPNSEPYYTLIIDQYSGVVSRTELKYDRKSSQYACIAFIAKIAMEYVNKDIIDSLQNSVKNMTK